MLGLTCVKGQARGMIFKLIRITNVIELIDGIVQSFSLNQHYFIKLLDTLSVRVWIWPHFPSTLES